jgi:ABC-type Na+ efflux pump permease subunit
MAFSVMTGLFLSGPVSREKAFGILEILLSAPVCPAEILFSKAMGTSAYGFIVITIGLDSGALYYKHFDMAKGLPSS